MPTVIMNQPVIAAGESLSSALDVTGANTSLAQIIFPATWWPQRISPPLTFQVSPDGAIFYDLYSESGELLTVIVTPGAAIILSKDKYRGSFFKFRSGMPNAPVVQQETQTFTCILD